MNFGITALFLSLCALTLSFCSVYLCTREKGKKEAVTIRVSKEFLVAAILNAWKYKDEDEEADFEEGVECVLRCIGLDDVYEAFELATTEYGVEKFDFGKEKDDA